MSYPHVIEKLNPNIFHGTSFCCGATALLPEYVQHLTIKIIIANLNSDCHTVYFSCLYSEHKTAGMDD